MGTAYVYYLNTMGTPINYDSYSSSIQRINGPEHLSPSSQDKIKKRGNLWKLWEFLFLLFLIRAGLSSRYEGQQLILNVYQ